MEHFISNQIIKQLDSLYKLKATTQTLPTISTKIFKLFASEPTLPSIKKRGPPEKSIRLGYPTSLVKKTGKRLYLYDVNSLYPFSFINKFPSGINASNTHKYVTITKATITPPNFLRIPYSLPLNSDKDEALYSPQEITYLTKLGYVFNISDKMQLPYRTDIITDFIIHLFSRKPNHPRLVKHLLNSFYGKMVSSESSNITSLMVQYMISYSKIYTHKIKFNHTNLSIYTDTDSFTVQHPFKVKTSRRLGYCKSLLLCSKTNTADTMKIVSPRNYNYQTENQEKTKKIGTEHNLSCNKKSLQRNLLINGREVNSISIVEFIYN